MLKFGRKWNARMVIHHQNRDAILQRIEEETGARPGAPKMIRHYQGTIHNMIDEMSEGALELARETAEEWTRNAPPPEVQARVAGKKAPAFMEHFSSEMWRQCGMRIFVLSAWKNEEGNVITGT